MISWDFWFGVQLVDWVYLQYIVYLLGLMFIVGFGLFVVRSYWRQPLKKLLAPIGGRLQFLAAGGVLVVVARLSGVVFVSSNFVLLLWIVLCLLFLYLLLRALWYYPSLKKRYILGLKRKKERVSSRRRRVAKGKS